MSLNTILSTASSGLLAAQQGLRTVSDNIANVNTPGYVRKVVDQTSQVTMGAGSGVDVQGVRRVIDRYLQTASLTAAATSGKAGVTAELMDRVQSLFGDPSAANSFFSRLDGAFADFAALSNDPSSSLARSAALDSLQVFFDDAARISASMNDLRAEADTRLRSGVGRVNDLLSQIAQLNGEISHARYTGADSSGSENIQAQLVTELSGLINFQSAERADGGLVLRTEDGMLLADSAAAKLSYESSSSSAGYLTIVPGESGDKVFDARFSSGEITGLLQMRDQEIPGALAQLAEYTGRAAQELNRIHNGYTAVPAPAALTGRDTGLDIDDAVEGLTGGTTLAFMDSAGVIQNRVAITFTGAGGSISVNGGSAATFTSADFDTVLDGALTGFGGASFSGGVLSLTADSGGVAVVDGTAAKAGQSFSQFFGLNDLVRSGTFAPYDTGLTLASDHDFAPNSTISLRISDPSGARLRDVTVKVPAAGDMSTLLAAMNGPTTGVGGFGQFTLDDRGRMIFTPSGNSGATISVIDDKTSRNGTGPSISALFGIGPAQQSLAAGSFAITKAVDQNPALVATAKVNLAATTQPAVALADGAGAAALSMAGDSTVRFAAVNRFAGTTTTISRYATEFAGLLGRRAAAAATTQASAEAVATEAENRRMSYEGVNMDEELVLMTTYQQAFNASARLIQAAQDMYDVLLGMMR